MCVDDFALDLVGPSSVVSQTASTAGNIDVLGHAVGFSIVESLDGGEELSVLQEEVGELDEELSTVLGCLLPPWAVEGLAGSSDGNVDILLGGLLDGADDLLGGRVDDVEGLAVDSLHELVVDEADAAVSNRCQPKQYPSHWEGPKNVGRWENGTYRPVGCSYSPVCGVLSVVNTILKCTQGNQLGI